MHARVSFADPSATANDTPMIGHPRAWLPSAYRAPSTPHKAEGAEEDPKS
jgi:hypothetical protein